MKSAVETISPTRVKLVVEVPFAELKPMLDQAYQTIGAQVQIPGFRKGKVPSRIIDQRVGRGAVVQEAVNEALPRFFAEAAEAENVRAIGQPEVDVTAVPLEDGQDLEFTVETDVRPEIELPDLEGIAVEVDEVKASDEDVEERLTALRERFGTLVGVERAVEDGDFVSLDLSAMIGEEEIDSVTDVSYEVGSKNMLEGLDEALLGLAAGDTKTFTAPLAGGDHEGDDAECTVTVKAVKVRDSRRSTTTSPSSPPSSTPSRRLRADVTKQAEQAKKYEQGIQARDKVLEHLLDTVEVPVPDGIVEAEVHQHLEGENRLDDEHRAEVQESTRKALRAQFLLDAIAEKLEVRVEQPELIEYLVMSAQQYGMDPNEFAQSIDQQGQIPSIVQEVARARRWPPCSTGRRSPTPPAPRIDLDELVPRAADAGAESEGDAAPELEETGSRRPARGGRAGRQGLTPSVPERTGAAPGSDYAGANVDQGGRSAPRGGADLHPGDLHESSCSHVRGGATALVMGTIAGASSARRSPSPGPRPRPASTSRRRACSSPPPATSWSPRRAVRAR